MSTNPPDDPWQVPDGPPPPPGAGWQQPGGYPPPPPPGAGWQQPGGYPPPPPPGAGWQQPGAPVGVLAGWWQRVGATFIDGLCLLIPSFIIDIIFRNSFAARELVTLIVQAAYTTILITQSGQTVGNRAVGTRVVDAQTGGPVPAGRALLRWAAEIMLFVLLVIPGLLDLLWPLWDQQNQTLHDKIAGTVVLRK